MAEQLGEFGLTAQRDEFTADVPGLGSRPLVNLFALAPGRSPETIVVMAHRDNTGEAPGANDNASGTAALLEIARNVDVTQPVHTLLFVSTDGGAFGAVGAARFAAQPEIVRRLAGGGASIVAVVSLDAIAGGAPARLAFAGDASRSPSASLVATADGTVADETNAIPGRPSLLAQVVDLAFPFALNEQGPFVAQGIPAVTITTGSDERPPRPETDTLEALAPDQLGELGRASQELVLALDATAELARGTESYLYTGTRLIRGWTIQLLLFAALMPFLVAVVDLFARCRRRRVALGPALRSFASRLAVWVWVGILIAVWSAAGLLPGGEPRPLSPDSAPAGDWPVIALVGLALASGLGWLVARPRLAPHRPVGQREELGGHLAAMLVLGAVALVVVATSPYALLFLLPSLHAWLWLPHVPRRNVPLRVGVFLAGLAGPGVLVGSFAVRFGLGFDAPWYVLALVSVGYVAPPFLLAALVWSAAAAQVGALAFGRYAPYPGRGETPMRGPLRAGIRRAVLARRRRRAARDQPEGPELRVVGDE